MLHFENGPGAIQSVAGSGGTPKNDHDFVDLLAQVLMPLMQGAMTDQADKAAAASRALPN